MALSDNDKLALRRMIPFSDAAASIITKIDTPGSSITAHEFHLLELATGSNSIATEIAGKCFFPSAIEARTDRLLQNQAGNQVTGQHIASEIGS